MRPQLGNELSGQPGAPAATASSTGARSQVAGATSAAAPAAAATPTTAADLLPAVAANVRKLRMLTDKKWKENPSLQLSAQELSDVMQLYVDEVKRLQGVKPSSGDTEVLAAPTPRVSATCGRHLPLSLCWQWMVATGRSLVLTSC